MKDAVGKQTIPWSKSRWRYVFVDVKKYDAKDVAYSVRASQNNKEIDGLLCYSTEITCSLEKIRDEPSKARRQSFTLWQNYKTNACKHSTMKIPNTLDRQRIEIKQFLKTLEEKTYHSLSYQNPLAQRQENTVKANKT